MLVSVMILILCALNETSTAGTQHNLPNGNINGNNSLQPSLNSTNINLELDNKQLVVTWLEANETEADNRVIVLYVNEIMIGNNALMYQNYRIFMSYWAERLKGDKSHTIFASINVYNILRYLRVFWDVNNKGQKYVTLNGFEEILARNLM